MANTLKFGNSEWYGSEGNILAYNDENGNFKPLPFDFSRGSIATRVNQQGLIETVGTNDARVDYLDNANGALLLEPQRTNLETKSNEFPTWSANSNITRTANYIISPDGTLNGTRLQFTGNGFCGNTTQTNSTQYTVSCYARRNDSATQNVGFFINGSGVVNSAWSITSEWKRFTYTYTSGNASFVGIAGISGADISVFGFQFEQGSYPTSYIPTQGSAVTRLADACNQTVPDGVIGQTEGTVFLDFKILTEDEVNANIFNTNKNTTNAIAVIRLRSVEKIQVQTFFSSVNVNYLATNTCDIGDRIKLAFKYKNGDVKLYINGILENSATPTFTISSPLSEINLADNVTYFARKEGIDFTSLQLYNTALTDAELVALTQV